MPTETYSLQRLLTLRRLTRAISDLLSAQLKEHLNALGPVLRPRNVFGEFVSGAGKDMRRGPEQVFRELQTVYQSVAAAKPFGLTVELSPPLELSAPGLELVPIEYAHAIQRAAGAKTVTVTSPLQWVLFYPGFTPGRLKELAAAKDAPSRDVQQFILHYTALNFVLMKQPGVVRLLEALRYSVNTVRLPELGQVPVTAIAGPVTTVRPPDDLILDSTELSGKDVFEEVVNLEDIRVMRDPLREKIVELARSFGEEIA